MCVHVMPLVNGVVLAHVTLTLALAAHVVRITLALTSSSSGGGSSGGVSGVGRTGGTLIGLVLETGRHGPGIARSHPPRDPRAVVVVDTPWLRAWVHDFHRVEDDVLHGTGIIRENDARALTRVEDGDIPQYYVRVVRIGGRIALRS